MTGTTASPLDAVVFDVDGTLVDSERDGHRVAFNDAFAAAGLPHRWDVATYGRLLAVTGGQRRLRAFLEEVGHGSEEASRLAAALHADKTRRFVAMIEDGQVPPRPGAHRLLVELQDLGVVLAVATTGRRAWVGPLLERTFPDVTFVRVFTGDDVTATKPDPAVYRLARDELALDRARTLVVEDAARGVAAAVGAGLDCLVVVNDYTRHERVGDALLVVDGFGDGTRATVLAGDPALLDDGAVTARTCTALRAAPPGAGHHHP